MKTKHKTPYGWRRLKSGEAIKLGDRYAPKRLAHPMFEVVSGHLTGYEIGAGFELAYYRRKESK